jgi:hypothetical protein
MLLEFACQLCMSDPTDQSLADFSVELFRRDWRYFILLPGICNTPEEFKLPQHGPHPESQLIAALFDLIRNGQHISISRYVFDLMGGDFGFALTGAQYGFPLRATFANGRPSDHLEASRCQNSDIRMIIRTGVLFLDLRDSTRGARLGSRGFSFSYLSRPRPPRSRRPRSSPQKTYYSFTAAELWQCLQTQGR